MANVQAFTVSTIGNAELNDDWTEADQQRAIAMIESGTMPSGEQAKAGDYPFHGQTLRIRKARGKTNKVVEFAKGFKGKRLADDAYTERDENGGVIKKTKDTVTPMSAAVAGFMSKDGGIVTTNTQLKSLIATLYGTDRQDAYSRETQSLGRLRTTEFLILPSDLTTPEVPDKDVGTDLALKKLDPVYVFSVYALNKAVNGSTDNIQNVKFGVLRMEAVKWGWVKDQREIRYMPVPGNLAEIIEKDAEEMAKHVKSAALAAWLVPFAAEHVFRTTGQIQSSTSLGKYEQIFRACLAPDVSKYMEADVLYRKALHWISPERVWAVLKAAKDEDRIPGAIRLRMRSAPAGTALITTSSAVLDSMKRMELYAKMESMNIADFEKIVKVDRLIREDPPKYHNVPSAYGRAALSSDDRKEVEDAKREAAKVAPITKAFVDAMLGRDTLARQQVLNKYAEMNPYLYVQCKKFFGSINKKRPKSIEEV